MRHVYTPEERRIAARPGNRRRQRKHRLLVKRRIREAKRAAKLEIKAAIKARRDEREAKRQWRLRKNATAHQGTVDGFGAVTPMDDAQMQALSYSRRYRTAYLEAAAEKRRWLAAMAKQQAPPSQPPRIIRLT
jgi:hypothetical protein